MSEESMGFVHKFVASESGDDVTLLLLHGTGGDENDLIPLGQALRPSANMLSPRGNVLEHGMPRFFRRLAEGVFDMEDLARRSDELAQFIADAAERYKFDASKVISVGFSNGANIAASVILKHPGVIRRAALLSAMLPFEPASSPALSGTSVFIGAGRNDPIVPAAQVNRLEEILRAGGADVAVHWHNAGHSITKDELEAARVWISN
jgi:phospholipase/carboxylesterase